MAEEVPENRTQADIPEQQLEHQPKQELAHPEEPQVAAEPDPEPEAVLEQPETTAEQRASDDAQEPFDPPQYPSSEELETSVPDAPGAHNDKVSIDNEHTNDTANQTTNETQNNAPEKIPETILELQDNTVNDATDNALTDVPHHSISNRTIDDATEDKNPEVAEVVESTEDTAYTDIVTPAEPESAESIELTEPPATPRSAEFEPTESLVQPSNDIGPKQVVEQLQPAEANEATERAEPGESTEIEQPAEPYEKSVAQANQFTTQRSPVPQPAFSNPNFAPSTASSSSMSQAASSIPRAASPNVAASIKQDDTPAPIRQPVPVSPLKPVLPPSPSSQGSIPSQRVASPAQSHGKQATSSGHRNSGSVSNYASSGSLSPMQKLASPVQKPTYPTCRAHSPMPKIHSPLARPYYSPMMSPHQTMHSYSQMGHPNQSMLPGAFPGYGGAFQSPVLSASGYLPPYTQNAYQGHSPMYPQQPQSQQPPAHDRRYSSFSESSFMPSFQNLRDLSMMNGNGVDGKFNDVKGSVPQPDVDGENIFLLQRLNDAIPDLSRLLHGYKATQNKLMARESEIKQMQTQYEQSTMRKDFYIEALQNQMRKAANDNAEEISKLKHAVNEVRLELGDLDEKHKDLQEAFAESQKSNEELSQHKAELECDVAKLSTDLTEEQDAHERAIEALKQEREEALATQERELTDTFEGVMAEEATSYREAMKAIETKLLDQQRAMKNEYEEQKRQIQEAYDVLQADSDAKTAELESTQTDLSDTKINLDASHKEFEETREIYINEIETINAAFSDKERQWEEQRTDLETQLSHKDEALASMEQERQKLEGDCILKETQLQHAMNEMRATMENLGKDYERLMKTLSSLGEATDLKSSKGDEFFLESFDELRRSIVTLSKEHFAYLPIDPPKSVLAKVPSELPSFLDNMPASRELRSAYIQHVISKTLNYRIFQPFLFTLGRRYDNADIFFQMLSMDIRRKSVRREAFWRQQTLKAAYTAPDAKHSINMTASVIVDEIVDHIKHFADPTQLDPLVMGVRKIVKLAAETWRHARIERGLIVASLPAPDAEGASNQDWEEYGTDKKGGGSGHVLLRMFPQIAREVAHEDLVRDEETESPCTYSAGNVLYSDSPIIIARRQELAARKRKSV